MTGGLCALLLLTATAAAPAPPAAPPTAEDLAGAWSGDLSHAGQTTTFGFELAPAEDGKVLIRMAIPAIHVRDAGIGPVPLETDGSRVRLGPFDFAYDAEAATLSGVMPGALVPVYEVPIVLRRVESLALPPRPALAGEVAEPVWTFDAGSPQWPGATYAGGLVYSGGEDGRLHALDAETGEERWSFAAGGAIRTRATVAGGTLYLQADDGVLYALDAASGDERWRTRVMDEPVVRLPFSDPESRYDRFGSDVTVAGEPARLYLGTVDGRLLALDPEAGTKVWEHAAGNGIYAAPAVAGGRVFFGSFDHHVYALNAKDGTLLWRHDTRGPVMSTPAVAGDLVLVGSRSYDFLALDAATGEPAWSRYVWFSWIESSATVDDGVAYVGSSDAAALFALRAATGEPVWTTDVRGWAWGQPAVTEGRVYIGAASTAGYLVGHQGGVLAVDRKTGRVAWHFDAAPAESGTFGFPGSPAVGGGLVFATGLDGKVHAFRQ